MCPFLPVFSQDVPHSFHCLDDRSPTDRQDELQEPDAEPSRQQSTHSTLSEASHRGINVSDGENYRKTMCLMMINGDRMVENMVCKWWLMEIEW